MNRNVVITGASRGIGLALAKHYKNQSDNVYAICRTANPELKTLGVEVIDSIELSDSKAIDRMATVLSDTPIDILINNAGVWGKEALGSIDYENLQRMFNVNAVAPLRVTESLLNKLSDGSKVAMITSRMGSIEDNSGGSGYDYRMSKAALNMAGKTLAVDLLDQGIAVAILHPGFVATDMVGGVGDIQPEIAAERLAQRIEELNIKTSGSFWHSNGEVLPW